MKPIRKTVGLSLITASMLAMAASSAVADGRGCGKGPGFGKGAGFGQQSGANQGNKLERLASRLDLNDAQKTQVETILGTSKAERDATRTQLQENREALREATHNQPYNASLVRSLADQQGDLKANMIVLRANDHSQISGVLTEAQREKFNQQRQHRKHRRGMKRGMNQG